MNQLSYVLLNGSTDLMIIFQLLNHEVLIRIITGIFCFIFTVVNMFYISEDKNEST